MGAPEDAFHHGKMQTQKFQHTEEVVAHIIIVVCIGAVLMMFFCFVRRCPRVRSMAAYDEQQFADIELSFCDDSQ